MDRNEDTHTITFLVQSLTSQLEETSSQILSLELAAKSLVSKEQYEELISGPPQNLPSPEANDDLLIQELEKQRLRHVMHLQKQDFISEKLVELIDQNKGIIESVKEYFQHRDSICMDEQHVSAKRLEHYKHQVMGPNINLLDLNLTEMNTSIAKLCQIYDSTIKSVKSDDEKLFSPEYQTKVDELVNSLNKVFDEYLALSNETT